MGSPSMPTWSAPVRYAEADQLGVVFNAHYLLYCDEAMGTFCAQRGLGRLVEAVRLKTSTLTWSTAAIWGETIEVYASCRDVGRTSVTMHFELRVGERDCCVVDTVYVQTDASGASQEISADDRARLVS